MGRELTTDWHAAAASALEWWRDAGVDMLVDDAPRDWLGRAPGPAPIVAPAPAVASQPLPATLAEFIAWRMGEAAPEAGWFAPRVAPSGPAGGLMILADVPEDEDRDAPITGAPGRLLDRMLEAIGESRESVHVATLAWARPIGGQLTTEDEQRLALLARHHVRLAAPNRLLLFGETVKRALAAASDSNDPNGLSALNPLLPSMPVATSFHPRFLMNQPGAKAQTWAVLLPLSRGNSL